MHHRASAGSIDLAPSVPVHETEAPRFQVRVWVPAVAAAEVVGFLAPTAAALAARNAAGAVQLVTLVAAGLVEGAALGWGQASVLRRAGVLTERRRWVVLTSAAAGVAWLIGMLPSTTHDVWSGWPVAVAVVVGAGLGVLLLISIGWVQARLLAAVPVRHAYRWVGWTALGWAAGLSAFGMIAPPLWHEGQSAGAIAVIGAGAAAVMAVAMATVTGLGMRSLLKGRTTTTAGPRPAGPRHADTRKG